MSRPATRKARDPHAAIVKAAKRGTGLRLSADEVRALAEDSAIQTRADFVMNPDPVEGTQPWPKPR